MHLQKLKPVDYIYVIKTRETLSRKCEVFTQRALNHIVAEPLFATFCDPLIATRVLTMQVLQVV